jgi:predicted phage baseplate assembly protein
MPLEAPQLDDRTFEELLREARLRIPRYTKEWTDFNDSDPGITIVQLFAWLTEMMLYRMNKVPERNYIKFLKLLNMELRPAQPAVAHVTFTAQPGAVVEPVRPRSQIQAQPPEGGDPLVFETEEGLDLVRVPLTDVQVYDGSAFSVLTRANSSPGTPFRPLGWVPQVDSALYLGFAQTDPPAVGRPFPQQIRLRVFLPAEAQAGIAQGCREVEQPPAPPVTLAWEYRPNANAQRWRRLNLYKDESAAFSREGYIVLEGPAEIEPTQEGRVPDLRFWLRGRLASGSYPTDQSPEIDFIRPNTVPAQNLSTVREEIVGVSEGHPDQLFKLRRSPVQPTSLGLWTEVEGQDPERWEQVEDFLASQPDDPHYVLNANTGEIRFGDGQRGRIPTADAEIIARQYRYGGGAAGNVGSALINIPLTAMAGVESVTNERPAVGGRDEQPIEELKEQAPRVLRSRNRAVTGEDFAALAGQAGGVKKATAIPLRHPDHTGVEVPGAVTVVIVPDSRDVPPKPSSDLIRQVCRYLSRFRLITTEVYVKGPEYYAIKVEARVAAQPYAAPDTVTRDVVEALNAFLDPLGRGLDKAATQDKQADGKGSKGTQQGEQGWRFGQELFPTSLYSVILNVADVAAVRSLALTVNGRPHELTKPVILPADGLVYGADHEIDVVPLTDL